MKYKKGNAKKKLVNSEVVRVKDNKKKDIVLLFIFIFLLAGLVFFYVWQRLENVELAYSIENIKQEINKETETNLQLKMQLEQLKDLKRIKKVATERIGLREPKQGEILKTKSVEIKFNDDNDDRLTSKINRNKD